eukprot:gnl/Spiro4/11057_TR5862_c0_g1_i1.p1 gnl/Spiro4/11057_TR5862_c0_g1~~gnl/Spiro4/11057_TR5862_c0_g1_i1.p1  ORF type:complete len:301 (+),score=108.23 gnl/Spiro4/11057_TR5862_c0_g1_i1:47-904(+)
MASRTSVSFRWEFDWYTPRPHLIFLRTDPPRGHSRESWDSLVETEQRVLSEFVFEVLASPPVLLPADQPAVLSIHRFGWQETNQFHVHVCLEVAPYLAALAASGRSATARHISKNWAALSDLPAEQLRPENYADLVCRSGRNKYWLQDLADAAKALDERSATTTAIERFTAPESCGVELVFHPSHPRIGIRHNQEPCARGLVRVLDLLRRVERSLMPLLQHRSDGWHWCVALTNAGLREFDEHFAQPSVGVTAYLQLHPAMYCRVVPDPRGWLSQAREHTGFLMT